MKSRLLLLGLVFGMILPAWAQEELDVTQVTADPKSFVFSNNRNTVKGYIYQQLEAKTQCCGEVRMYLEVKIDPSGYVINVKPLTGKDKQCYAQSAIDIVKNIRWDATGFKGAKSVYFEIKPEIDCKEGRSNEYAAIPVFNNELFDEEGNRVNLSVTATSTPGQEEPAETPAPIVATPVEQPADQPAKPEAEIVAQPVEEVVAAAPENTPPPAREDPIAPPEDIQTPPDTAQEVFGQPVATAFTDESGVQLSDEDRQRREDEIQFLRDQLAQMRAQEEIRAEGQRQRMEAIARERREREEQAGGYAAEGSENYDESNSGGGLFLDDSGSEGSSDGADYSAEGSGEDERLQNDIAQLEQRKRDLEDQQRQREEEARRILDERARTNEELLVVEEELLRKTEESAQYREQQELDQMDRDSQNAGEDLQRQRDEYTRLMDEIRRLQDEADTKIAEMERLEGDINGLETQKQAREQEVMLARELRRKEQEAELERRRLGLQSQSGYMASDGSDLPPGLVLTASDSDKYVYLVSQIDMLKMELDRLREYISTTGGNPPPASYSSGTQTGSRPPAANTSPGNFQRADQDNSWKNVNYKAPGVDEKEYVAPIQGVHAQPTRSQTGNPPTSGEPGYESGEGYSPAPSHIKTHKNVEGIVFDVPETAAGQQAMKNHLKDKLRQGGICGLAQSAFELTISPDGKVIGHRVIAANSALVEQQLNTVLPGIEFQPTGVPIPQRVYMEFKAEIICEGARDKVNLREVPDYINR